MIPLRAGSGVWLEDFAGKRYLDGISSWWVNLFGHANPRINAAVREQLERLEHAIFAGFTHQPAVTLAEELTRIAPRGAQPLLLRRQRLGRGRSGREDELSLLAQHRSDAQDALHHARQQLPRRDAGRAGRGQRRSLQGHLPAAAHGRDHRAVAGRIRARSRRERGTTRRAHVRAHGGGAGAAPRRSGRGHRRAAGAMRRRHAHVRPAVSQTTARGLRQVRRAPDRRRDRGGLRAHRHDVRLRAGRHPARLPVPVEGPHRRLPAAVRGADHRRHLRRVLRRIRQAQRLPAFAQLHRQPAGLRRGERHAGDLPRAAGAGAQSRTAATAWRPASRTCAIIRTSPRSASAA